MQTPTNVFITNMAFADIFMNFFSSWLTPVYVYVGSWIFGGPACYVMSTLQGMSIFISTMTLTSIAVDRYVAIIHPLKQRPTKTACVAAVCGIWMIALLLVLPYSLQLKHYYDPECFEYRCYEIWSDNDMRRLYSFTLLVIPYGVPLLIISFCYLRISLRLWKPNRMLGARSAEREAAELVRKRRLVRMLITMVVVFTICALPLYVVNIIKDADDKLFLSYHFTAVFLVTHWIQVSATCWNPILYGFMNENFRREFAVVFAKFRHTSSRIPIGRRSGRNPSMFSATTDYTEVPVNNNISADIQHQQNGKSDGKTNLIRQGDSQTNPNGNSSEEIQLWSFADLWIKLCWYVYHRVSGDKYNNYENSFYH